MKKTFHVPTVAQRVTTLYPKRLLFVCLFCHRHVFEANCCVQLRLFVCHTLSKRCLCFPNLKMFGTVVIHSGRRTIQDYFVISVSTGLQPRHTLIYTDLVDGIKTRQKQPLYQAEPPILRARCGTF